MHDEDQTYNFGSNINSIFIYCQDYIDDHDKCYFDDLDNNFSKTIIIEK